jgi:DNA-binding PadR family transcriptional regulator
MVEKLEASEEGLNTIVTNRRVSESMSEAQTLTETSTARNLTAFQKNILSILSEEPMYGLAIKRELEDYYGEEVNHGRLYPNLDTLVEKGYVEKSELDKRTNQYELTDEGLAVVVDLLEWTLSKFVTGDDRAEQVRDLVADNE